MSGVSRVESREFWSIKERGSKEDKTSLLPLSFDYRLMTFNFPLSTNSQSHFNSSNFNSLNYLRTLSLDILSQMTTKENILSTLKTHKHEFAKYGVMNVGLFGSYLRNEQSAKSDIDLLIDFEPEKENFDNYMAVYDLFENLFKNEKIEIVTKNGLSKYIGPKILKDVVYV